MPPRLVVHVEGPTEETFVNEILAPHLMKVGYVAVWPRIVGNARLDRRSGGIKSWSAVRTDITRHLLSERGCLATTMVDYYGLPKSGDKVWPGRHTAPKLAFSKRANHVEDALLTDFIEHAGDRVDPRRFLPFVVMHEFEGLLFSDCSAFARGIGVEKLRDSLQKIRDEFETPEHINDSPVTAPSKRVIALVPGYRKPFLGTLAALEIGLEKMRDECPHFRKWIEHLENWPSNQR